MGVKRGQPLQNNRVGCRGRKYGCVEFHFK